MIIYILSVVVISIALALIVYGLRDDERVALLRRDMNTVRDRAVEYFQASENYFGSIKRQDNEILFTKNKLADYSIKLNQLEAVYDKLHKEIETLVVRQRTLEKRIIETTRTVNVVIQKDPLKPKTPNYNATRRTTKVTQ
jgi:predicted nuclease with TOPRIM domain